MQRLSLKNNLIFLATLLAFTGCGSGNRDPYHRNAIQGTVNLDGQPLATGSIVFFPLEQGPVVSGTAISNGKFMIPSQQGLPSGNYKVAITSVIPYKASPAESKDTQELPPAAISIIPLRYNTQTVLTSEVQNSTENSFTFELKSN